MEKLQELPNISRVSDSVIRILGQNPGKYTLQGTNTYLVGTRPPYILIDTGEGKLEYSDLLSSALRSPPSSESSPTPAGHSDSTDLKPYISDIIITHRHRDHFGGLRDVLMLVRQLWENDLLTHAGSKPVIYVPPRVHKFPSPPPIPSTSRSSGGELDEFVSASGETAASEHDEALHVVLASLIPASYTPGPSSVLHDLTDGQRLRTADGSAELEVLHTPGHTPDSICILLRPLATSTEKDKPKPKPMLFTADSVLGQGTAVFEDLAAYISSLRRVLAKRSDNTEGRQESSWDFGTVFPGHGPVVSDGPALIQQYITHRMEREAQIVEVLRGVPPASPSSPGKDSKGSEDPDQATGQKAWSIWSIVSIIYKNYPTSLWLPAAHGIGLHLKKLEKEGRAKCLGGEGVEQKWSLTAKL